MDDLEMGRCTCEYYALGELKKQTDAKGQIATMTYDVLGCMIRRCESEGEIVRFYDRRWVGALCYETNARAVTPYSRDVA